MMQLLEVCADKLLQAAAWLFMAAYTADFLKRLRAGNGRWLSPVPPAKSQGLAPNFVFWPVMTSSSSLVSVIMQML